MTVVCVEQVFTPHIHKNLRFVFLLLINCSLIKRERTKRGMIMRSAFWRKNLKNNACHRLPQQDVLEMMLVTLFPVHRLTTERRTHVFSPARSYIKATLVESRHWQHHSNCTDTSWHSGLSLKLRATQFGPLVPRHRAVCPTERRIWSPSTCMCSMSVGRQNPADLLLFISCTEPSHTINWPTHVKGNTHTHTQNHTLTQPHKHTQTHSLTPPTPG